MWVEVGEPSDVVEIIADPIVRHAMAEELGVPHALHLGSIHVEHDPVLWVVAARFRTICLGAAKDAPVMPHLECDELLHLLYRRVFITKFGGRRPGKGDGALDERRLKRVVEYVEANLGSPLTIHGLAAVAALSPFHFLRSFRRSTGVTPHEFVQCRRMDRARLQLNAGADIRAVARAASFSQLRHFREMYFRYHGLRA
jgi:AraC family transcriptional regulator